jgi:hypothetical protein
MRRLRYILVLLFVLSYRGLSAQEFDLYDFRYYKRFDTVEELTAPEKDTTEVAKFILNRNFSTRALDYNFSAIRFARRGLPQYERRTLINGLEIDHIGNSAIRALQLDESRSADETRLRIDTLKESRTSAGFSFSSRNTPYSISLATAHKFANDWSLAANLIAKTGRDLHIEGLFGNSLEFNAIATKRWDDKHTFSMAMFARPSMRSTRLASTQEAFRLTGNNLYNPAWGYEGGKVRNSRIRREFLPTAFVGYDWQIDKRTTFNLAALLTAGIEKYSSLDWFDAQTPTPDNYRYMPSYFVDEVDIFHSVENAWLSNDTRYTQINFDQLILSNHINGDAATYAISDRVRRTVRAAFRGGATTVLDKGTISYGLEAATANYRNYKQMRDLLEAKYIIDLDYFLLDDDSYGNSLQNNLSTPDRRIYEGDRFSYDYALRKREISAFAAYHYSSERLYIDAAAKVGYCDISRRGFYRKELFADNSLGVSRHVKLSPYHLRVKAGYLIADNHYIDATLATEATPCDEENLFLQSQYNNRTIDTPTLRTNYNSEVRYIFQRPEISVVTTLFIAARLNDTKVRHLYYDLQSEYCDVVNSHINTLCYGLEVEAEYRFADHFRATAAATIGRYKCATNSLVTIYTDTANTLIADHVESNMKGLSLGNAPQVAVTAGLSYYNKGWWAAINANYAGLRYIEPSAIMRTNRILAIATSPEQLDALTTQERLRDAFTIDASLSKTLYINRLSKRVYSTTAAPRFEDKHPKSRLIFRVGVRNLLGSSNIVYNAYEASRLQRYKLANEYIYSRQASRYLYAYPRTFYASATFAF